MTAYIFTFILALLFIEGAKPSPLAMCEAEEDLNGTTCRVDMLPDIALAQMVYDRGFDPDGASRLELLDAVMQLLEYEQATGEDLREIVYEAKKAYGQDSNTFTEGEQAVGDKSSHTAMDSDENASSARDQSEAVLTEQNESIGSAATMTSKCSADIGEETTVHEAENANVENPRDVDTTGERVQGDDEVVDDSSAAFISEGDGDRALVDRDGAVQTADTVVGYVKELGAEVARTIKRDMNAVVGLLPSPLANPIRDAAGMVNDTALKVILPALSQAERYTRGLRRGLGKSTGRLFAFLRRDVVPRVGRGMTGLLAKARRRVSDAVARRRENEREEGEDNVDVPTGQRHRT